MKKFFIKILFFFILAIPFAVYAKGANILTNAPANVTGLLNKISDFIIDPIIYVLFTVAFIVFIWGLVQFVASLDNEEARATGGKHMIWGLIGMAIMAGVNGIVSIILNTIERLGG